MEVVKKSKDFTILKKRSGRFGVKNANGDWVRGDEKAGLLEKAGLITRSRPGKKTEAPAAEEATDSAE